MTDYAPQAIRLRLQSVLTSFFVVVVLFAVVVFFIDPALFLQSLPFPSAPMGRAFIALCLLAIVGLVAFLCYGVVRHWRWVFWIVLVAFGASLLELPATLLQLTNIIPLLFPLWYTLVRLGVSMIQVVIAVWMFQIYRRYGVWALGKSVSKS